MSTFNSVTLYDETTVTDGSWVKTSRYDSGTDRGLVIYNPGGATVTIEVTAYWDQDDLNFENVPVDQIAALDSVTTTSAKALDGSWTAVRVTRTGADGSQVKVTGHI